MKKLLKLKLRSKKTKNAENRPSRKSIFKSPRVSAFIFLAFLIAINYLVSQGSFYMDLTQDKIYTASDASREILGNLKEPVAVTFYISKDLPSDLVFFRTQVEDVLNQYQDLSKGKLTVKYETPDSSTETAQKLAMKGVAQMQSQVLAKDKYEIKNFFFGAVVSAGEGDGAKTEALSSVTSLDSFEYDLVSAVYSVSRENKETIAFLMGHGERSISTADLAKSYVIKNVSISTEEGKKGFYVAQAMAGTEASQAEKEFVTPKTLVIVQPVSDLTAEEIAVLDEYVAGGGKVVVLSEKINIDSSLSFVTMEVNNNLNDFTKKYGIEINSDLVYDKSHAFIPYYFIEYPYWVKAIKDNFSDHPALSKIEAVTFLWVSSLKREDVEGYDVKDLITTTGSGELATGSIDISPLVSRSYLNGSKRTLAAISKAKNGDGQVIVIGDSDFVSPSFMDPISDNEIFFANLIDSISNSADLASIRSKSVSERPLRETDDKEKNIWKFAVIGGGALVLGLCGVMRLRRRKKKSAMAS
jgi:ABC-type uncharacterized transport system involved in gliding motility auxiliary subunit